MSNSGGGPELTMETEEAENLELRVLLDGVGLRHSGGDQSRCNDLKAAFDRNTVAVVFPTDQATAAASFMQLALASPLLAAAMRDLPRPTEEEPAVIILPDFGVGSFNVVQELLNTGLSAKKMSATELAGVSALILTLGLKPAQVLKPAYPTQQVLKKTATMLVETSSEQTPARSIQYKKRTNSSSISIRTRNNAVKTLNQSGSRMADFSDDNLVVISSVSNIPEPALIAQGNEDNLPNQEMSPQTDDKMSKGSIDVVEEETKVPVNDDPIDDQEKAIDVAEENKATHIIDEQKHVKYPIEISNETKNAHKLPTLSKKFALSAIHRIRVKKAVTEKEFEDLEGASNCGICKEMMPLSNLVGHIQDHIYNCLDKTAIAYDDHSMNRVSDLMPPEHLFMAQPCISVADGTHLCVFCGIPFTDASKNYLMVIKHYFRHHKEASTGAVVCTPCDQVSAVNKEMFFKHIRLHGNVCYFCSETYRHMGAATDHLIYHIQDIRGSNKGGFECFLF